MNAKIQRLKTSLDKFSKAGNIVDKLKAQLALQNWIGEKLKIWNWNQKCFMQEAAADEEKLKVD